MQTILGNGQILDCGVNNTTLCIYRIDSLLMEVPEMSRNIGKCNLPETFRKASGKLPGNPFTVYRKLDMSLDMLAIDLNSHV